MGEGKGEREREEGEGERERERGRGREVSSLSPPSLPLSLTLSLSPSLHHPPSLPLSPLSLSLLDVSGSLVSRLPLVALMQSLPGELSCLQNGSLKTQPLIKRLHSWSLPAVPSTTRAAWGPSHWGEF